MPLSSGLCDAMNEAAVLCQLLSYGVRSKGVETEKSGKSQPKVKLAVVFLFAWATAAALESVLLFGRIIFVV